MIKNIWKFALVSALIPVALQAQKQSGWDSLPKETVFAANLDFSDAITDKIRKETKLGKVVFSAERIAKLKEILRKHASNIPELSEFMTSLNESGMELDDAFNLFNNKFGIGVIPEKSNNHEFITVLMWIDFTDEALLNKVHNSITEKMGTEKDKKHSRVDFELDGEKIIHLISSVETSNMMYTKLGKRIIFAIDKLVDKDGNEDSISDEDVKAFEKEEKLRKKSGNEGLNLQPLQNEFVEGGEKVALTETEKKIQTDLSELLKAKLAQFLMAQKGTGSEFATEVNAKLGPNKIRANGDVIADLYLDLQKIFKYADAPMDELSSMGLDKLDFLHLSMAMDANKLNTTFFLASPAPRTGIMSLLDQPLIDPLPPEWIPQNALQYNQVSFDLNSLYNVIKSISINKLGAAAFQSQEQKANQSLMAFLGTDLQGLVNSFGSKHYVVGFGLDTKVDVNGDVPLTNKVSVVVEFNNEQVMKRLFDFAGTFAANQEGVKRSQEQGFDGYRINVMGQKFSIFYGFKKLVISTGQDVTEIMLSSIANPPKGPDALVNSKKFNDILKSDIVDKSVFFSYDDSASLVTMLYTAVGQSFSKEQILEEMDNENEKAFVNDLFGLIPKLEEVEGVIGSSITVGKPTDAGFIFKSTLSTP